MIAKKHIIASTLVSLILFSTLPAKAGENIPQTKSVAVATVLGLDMIPGDALFYAGKPGQAAGDIALALGGVATGFGGFYLFAIGVLTGSNWEDSSLDTHPAWSPFAVGSGIVLMGAGAGMVIGSVIWDVVGGIKGVRQLNSQIEAKRNANYFSSIRPNVAITPEGTYVGAQFRF